MEVQLIGYSTINVWRQGLDGWVLDDGMIEMYILVYTKKAIV